MLLKNNLASKSDKKVTIFNGEMRRLIGNDYNKDEVTVYYHGLVPITFKSTRSGSTWYAKQLLPNYCEMPLVGKPIYFEITLKSIDSTNKLHQGLVGSSWKPVKEKVKLKKPKVKNNAVQLEFLIDKNKKVSIDKFSLIRDWARERGLYLKGDVKTQFLKLQEETGELAKAILKDDTKEVIDAIGDIVVVLTNLTELTGIKIESKNDIRQFKQLTIEDCIDSAYNEIKNRKGKMQNGTFVKNER
jgi:NTP pyrophosphatase (non-canonical NTP hydrolase)